MSRFHYCAFFALLMHIWCSAGMAHAEETAANVPTVDWPELEKVWNQYLAYPSGDNARKVMKVLPTSGHVQYTHAADEDRVIELVSSNLDMLERQVFSGDRDATRLLFRLSPIVDGALAEDRVIILGALVRINPRLFLEEYKAYRSACPCRGYVENDGPPYVDKQEAQNLETELRLAALMNITDPELLEVRDECVAALKEIMSSLEKEEAPWGP